MSEVQRVKEELAMTARRAYRLRIQCGNGGNISGRVPGTDRVIIKASGCGFDECTPDNLITVDMEGNVIEGDQRASTELPTHLAIYRLRPDVFGVFHSHSPWAIAVAHEHDAIPDVTWHARAKLGPIPVLRLERPDQSDEIIRAVELLLAGEPRLAAFVQARHGIFSFAATITLASYHAELVEETAQIAWLTGVGTTAARRAASLADSGGG